MAVQLSSSPNFVLLLTVTAVIGVAEATVRRVPLEYPTVQAAFDELEVHDTVLVDIGTYAEALVAPPLSFVLLGNALADTGDYPRPVIDPSSLPGSDTLMCLNLPGGDSIIVRDFIFHNGAAMSRPGYTVGGIRNQASKFVATGCIWDSAYYALHSIGHSVCLENCRFTECNRFLVHTGSAALQATDVVFQGHSDWSLLQCGNNTTLTRCSISNSPGDAHLIIVVGTNVSFAGCMIGPSHGGWNAPIQASLRNSRFENNVFTGHVLGTSLFHNSAQCDSPLVFRNNVFLENHRASDTLALVPYMLSSGTIDTFSQCHTLTAEDNVFASSSCKAIVTQGQDVVRGNRFRDLTGWPPTVIVHWRHLRIHNSTFDLTGLAADADYDASIDATWNWWGHASGPYHAEQNPAGQGDTIVGDVDFSPWYPDTSFLAVRGLGKPLPESFVFEAYPNPFNSTVHLTLIPSQIGIVKVELFDLLGRRVNEIWQGPLAFEKNIAFDASALASGIYFARVSNVFNRRSLAVSKLVLLK